MTSKTAKLLLVAAVVLTAFTVGAAATTADASVNAQPITEDGTQSIDIMPHNDDFCKLSGVSTMCTGIGGGTCPYPHQYYC